MTETMIYPEATPVQGNTKVRVVTTIVNEAAPDLSSEIDAVTSLDISNFLRDWNPDLTANTGQAPPRLGSPVQLPREGNTNFAPIELRYVYDPQAASTTSDNKAKALLVEGTELYAVVRKGIDADTPFAAGDHVEVWRFRCGRQRPGRSGEDEFSEFEMVQNVLPQAVPTDGVVAA